MTAADRFPSGKSRTQPPIQKRAFQRSSLLARLAIERVGLLEQLLGLSSEALKDIPATGSWTLKDLLTHIAGWDRWQHQTMQALAENQAPDLSAMDDYHAANEAFVAAWSHRSLADVLLDVQAARGDWVTWLEDLPETQFFKRRSYAGEDWSFYGEQLQVMWRHDAEHAQEIATWSVKGGCSGTTGPKSVLLAALAASRQALLACAALVPSAERDTCEVSGLWALKDLLGHLADWERIGVQGLRDMTIGKVPHVEFIDDIDAWNQIHARQRQAQPWDMVWTDLFAVRHTLLEFLTAMDQEALDRSYPFPWGSQGTVYQWVTVFVGHDQEHAQDLWSKTKRL